MEIITLKNNYRIHQLLSGRSNVFLITGEKKSIMVDSGIALMRPMLKRSLSSLSIQQVDYLMLTHNHFDHVSNAAWIKETYGAKIIIHHSEALDLEKGRNTELPDGITKLTKPLVSIIKKISNPVVHFQPCQADLLIHESFDFNIVGLNIYVIHTPGHSPGSLTLIVDDEIALVGDSMFGVFPGSILPPFGMSKNEIIQSWGKQLKTGCRLYFPSHGSANIRNLVEKQYKRFCSLDNLKPDGR